MKNSFYIQILCACACLYTQSICAADISHDITERRQEAVQQAREGKFELSLPILAGLAAESPKDIGVVADYIVALTWAKKIKRP